MLIINLTYCTGVQWVLLTIEHFGRKVLVGKHHIYWWEYLTDSRLQFISVELHCIWKRLLLFSRYLFEKMCRYLKLTKLGRVNLHPHLGCLDYGSGNGIDIKTRTWHLHPQIEHFFFLTFWRDWWHRLYLLVTLLACELNWKAFIGLAAKNSWSVLTWLWESIWWCRPMWATCPTTQSAIHMPEPTRLIFPNNNNTLLTPFKFS